MSDPPKHNPPPSGQAPKPKGILKNPLDRRPSQNAPGGNPPDNALSIHTAGLPEQSHPNGLSWDESNIALHDFEKESSQRIKIDEPKTPFVHGTEGDDEGFDAFNLDQTPSNDGALQSGPASYSDKDRAAAELAANTTANASIGGAHRPSNSMESDGRVRSAVGLEAAGFALEGATSGSAGTGTLGGGTSSSKLVVDDETLSTPGTTRNSKRSQSRSPSFSLPSSGGSSRRASSRSTAGCSGGRADDVRSDVRQQKMDVGGNAGNDEEALDGTDDEEEEEDAEIKAQREAFAKKRNAHYGNEAEALRIAQALAAQEDEEDDEDGDEEMQAAGSYGS